MCSESVREKDEIPEAGNPPNVVVETPSFHKLEALQPLQMSCAAADVFVCCLSARVSQGGV